MDRPTAEAVARALMSALVLRGFAGDEQREVARVAGQIREQLSVTRVEVEVLEEVRDG